MENRNNLENIPEELKMEIFQYLDIKSKNNLALSCFSFYTAIHPGTRLRVICPILLQAVSYCHIKKLVALLKINSDLAFIKGDVIDLSGRHFKNISPIQLSAWYLDSEVLSAILKNIPENKRLVAWQQLDDLKKQGALYTLNGVDYNESHFNYSLLINAWQEYHDNFNIWRENQAEYHCLTVIGNAQRYVPVNLAKKICNSDGYYYLKIDFKNFHGSNRNKDYSYSEISWYPLRYELAPISEINRRIGVIYISDVGKNGIRYVIRNMKGDLIKKTIPLKMLTKDFPTKALQIIELQDKFLPIILEYLSNKDGLYVNSELGVKYALHNYDDGSVSISKYVCGTFGFLSHIGDIKRNLDMCKEFYKGDGYYLGKIKEIDSSKKSLLEPKSKKTSCLIT